MSWTLARFMCRSNLSSGTSFCCLDAFNASGCSIIIMIKRLRFTILRSTRLHLTRLHYIGIWLRQTAPCFTLLYLAQPGLDVALLYQTSPFSTTLRFAMLNCDVTILYFGWLNYSKLFSTFLHYTILYSDKNFALLNYSALSRYGLYRASLIYTRLL